MEFYQKVKGGKIMKLRNKKRLSVIVLCALISTLFNFNIPAVAAQEVTGESGTTYQALDATLVNASEIRSNPTFFTDGVLLKAGEGYIEFDVAITTASSYKLDFLYGANGTTERRLDLSINNILAEEDWLFPSTGEGWSPGSGNLSSTVYLNEGVNKVRLSRKATGYERPFIVSLTVRGEEGLPPPIEEPELPVEVNWESKPAFQQVINLGSNNTGIKTVEFDVTPTANLSGGVIVYAKTDIVANHYNNFGMFIQLSTDGDGIFKARNGETYSAINEVTYVANETYHVKMVTDLTAQIYSVYVTPPGGVETLIAKDYQFRKQLGLVTSDLGQLAVITGASGKTFTVKNHKIDGKLWEAPPVEEPTDKITYKAIDATVVTGSKTIGNPSFYTDGVLLTEGSYVEFDVNVPTAGYYDLDFFYGANSTAERRLDLSINGILIKEDWLFPTTATGWLTGYRDLSLTEYFNEGNNKVRLSRTVTPYERPFIVSLTVQPALNIPIKNNLLNLTFNNLGIPFNNFYSDLTSYDVYVSQGTQSIEISATLEDVNAIMKINGELWNGELKTINLLEVVSIEIEVTAITGEIKTYTVRVKEFTPQKEYYVSVDGDDDNDGSMGSPWKTIFYAANHVVPNDDVTIYVGEGTFEENRYILLPPRTSIEGAGVNKTIIKTNLTYEPTGVGDRKASEFLFQVRDTKDASISHLTIDAKIDDSTNAYAGIFIHNAENFDVHNVEILNFAFIAIYLTSSTNSHIYNSIIRESSMPHVNGCSGMIMLDELVDCHIYNNILTETRGAYGIKAGRLRENTMATGITYVTLERVKVYDNIIKLIQRGGWGNGQPNIGIEFWNSNPIDCEIYNNRFSNNLSMVSGTIIPEGQNTVRIHNNQFINDPMGPNYSYSIEVSMDNLEIDHNYFYRGIYPQACFESKVKEGHKIHNNIYYALESHSVVYGQTSHKDGLLENNIVYLNEETQNDVAAFRFINGLAENYLVRNNLFIQEPKTPYFDPSFVNLRGTATLARDFIIQSNLFYNWRDEGINAVTADPKFSTNDLRVAYDSPAHTVGFANINMANAGLTENFYFADSEDSIDRVWIKAQGDNQSKGAASLNANESLQLEVLGRTKNGYVANVLSATVTYVAQDIVNSNVINVTNQGIVTSMNAGVSKVTATVTKGGNTATSDMYIFVGDSFTSLVTDIDKGNLIVGDSLFITPSLKSNFGQYVKLSSGVTFSSADNTIASVDQTGKIIARGEGITSITVTDTSRGLYKEIPIIVEAGILDTVDFIVANGETLYLDQQSTLKMVGWLTNGERADLTSALVEYDVRDTNIIQITKDLNNPTQATILAKNAGKTMVTIRVEIDGFIRYVDREIQVYGTSGTDKVVSPWKIKHYGNDQGNVTYNNEIFTLTSSGKNIGLAAEELTFLYQDIDLPVDNDLIKFDVSATVNAFEGTNNTSSGFMIRDNNDLRAKHVLLRVRKNGTIQMISRDTYRQTAKVINANQTIVNWPTQVKLEKQGNDFKAYYKNNDIWEEITFPGDPITVDMSASIKAGVIACAADFSSPMSVQIQNIVVGSQQQFMDGISAIPNKHTLQNIGESTSIKVFAKAGTLTLSKELIGEAQYTFTSLNPEVATVDESGIVTGVSKGLGIIAVTAQLNDGTIYKDFAQIAVANVYGELAREGWIATASHARADAPVHYALDGSMTTRWGTGTAMLKGMYIMVDMQQAREFSKISVNSGTSLDYTRGYEVYISDDGENWGSAIKSGTGDIGLTEINLGRTVTARYFKIVSTSEVIPYWWSIFELNVYNDNDNADLLSLGTYVTPEITKDNTQYYINIPNNVMQISLTPMVIDMLNAKVTINGIHFNNGMEQMLPIDENTNTIDVVVTAADGTVKNYKFIRTKNDEDITLKEIKYDGKTVNLIDFVYSNGEYRQKIMLPSGTTNVPHVTAVANNISTDITVTQASSLPGTAEIEILSQSKNASAVYKLDFSVISTPLTPLTPSTPSTPSTLSTPSTPPAKVVTMSLAKGLAAVGEENIPLYVKPYIQNGRTMAGIRDMTLLLNVDSKNIIWDAKNKSILIKTVDKEIKLIIGQKYALVNDKKIEMDVAPEIKEGRAVLPIAHIGRILGIKVEFDHNTKEVTFVIK